MTDSQFKEIKEGITSLKTENRMLKADNEALRESNRSLVDLISANMTKRIELEAEIDELRGGDWIKIEDRLPEENSEIICSNLKGGWVRDSVRFINGKFQMRENSNVGGLSAFHQIDLKKSPKNWLPGFWCKPTHWMPLPNLPIKTKKI